MKPQIIAIDTIVAPGDNAYGWRARGQRHLEIIDNFAEAMRQGVVFPPVLVIEREGGSGSWWMAFTASRPAKRWG
jgi:hypothetical protein